MQKTALRPMNIKIRGETWADLPAIEAVTTSAFLNARHTSHTAQRIVDALRGARKLARLARRRNRWQCSRPRSDTPGIHIGRCVRLVRTWPHFGDARTSTSWRRLPAHAQGSAPPSRAWRLWLCCAWRARVLRPVWLQSRSPPCPAWRSTRVFPSLIVPLRATERHRYLRRGIQRVGFTWQIRVSLSGAICRELAP